MFGHDLGRVFLFPYNFSMNQKKVEWDPMKISVRDESFGLENELE